MKKILSKLLRFDLFLIIVALCFSLLITSTHSSKKQINTNSQKVLSTHIKKTQIGANMSKEVETQCQKSEKIIRDFLKKLPPKPSKNEAEIKNTRTLLLQDESLKKIIIENNKCGANTASWLANIYALIGLNEKAQKYHKIVVGFAEKNNTSAIENLCGYDSVSTKAQKLHYCKAIMDGNNADYKFAAMGVLGGYYSETNQSDELIELCRKAGDKENACQFVYLFPFGEKLHKEKNINKKSSFTKKLNL